MFASLRHGQRSPGEAKRLAASWAAATLLFGGAVLALFAMDGRAETSEAPEEAPLDVIFTSDLPEPPPPEPEPEPVIEPVIEEPPAPPPVAAPAHIPRKEVDTPPPPPKKLEAPEEIPEEPPKEGDAKDFAVAAAPPGEGDPAGRVGGTGEVGTLSALEPGEAKGPPKRRVRRKPVRLPEDARPPRMLASSGAPAFPQEMRSAGKEGLVVLKVVIREDGRITQWKVMQGEEPFLAAAIEWVKRTRWEPAIAASGEKLPVFKILRIPFRLRM